MGNEAGSCTSEFAGSSLGDERLDRRLEKIVRAVEATPSASFPKAMADESELEGFYRFIANEKVTPKSVLAPHFTATKKRVREHDEVLVLHDTTEFVLQGDAIREGLERIKKTSTGFLAHFALAVAVHGEERDALGVLGVEPWARTGESPTQKRQRGEASFAEAAKMPRESERWGKMVKSVSKQLGKSVDPIHIMDSEADDYALISELVSDDRRFVIRGCYDRVLLDPDTGSRRPRTLREFMVTRPVQARRQAKLSRRRRSTATHKRVRSSVRKERIANLAIRATNVVLRCPSNRDGLPADTTVNIVSVREVRPPKDQTRVEWTLLTTEPIETLADIERVIDHYRARWTIEEYFKALKTGCAYEKRQMESFKTLKVVLAILVPVAWNLLRLRSISRLDGDLPAHLVVTKRQLAILRRRVKRPLPDDPTVRDVMLGIAQLGGHLRSNGAPGWQVLGRGYHDLLVMEVGYLTALEMREAEM